MCGIAGIFAYGGNAPPVDAMELTRIRDRMAARGPDGAGLYLSQDRRVGLAHRRLSIIDLSRAGSQPMATPDGGLHIVFNGEIYNYRSLRDELTAEGVAFRTHSDTEVLLHLYVRDGAEMVHALRGMYAFAIWDDARQGLFLARDPFGIKPLYIADDGKSVRFASQVKALLAGGAVDTRPDPAGHAGYFLLGSVPEPYTLYRGIRQLEAGRTLWIDRDGDSVERTFFNLSGEIAAAEAIGNAGKFSPEALRAALLDTVRHHLVADVPVGAFLSSGLDSATLTALAAEVERAELRTVTLTFDEFTGTELDEAPLAEVTAAQYGTVHRTRRVSREEFAAERGKIMTAMDQPSLDGVNTYFVSKVTAETGLKAAISGLGGDEFFGGYYTFREVPRVVSALWPFKYVPIAGRAFRWISAPALARFTSPKWAGLFEYGGDYGGAYLLRRGLYMPYELPSVMDPDMAAEGWKRLALDRRMSADVAAIRAPRLKVSMLETAWYMRNQLLRDSDWAGMAHSLEIRVPLVDIGLFRALLPMLAGRRPPGKRDMALTPQKPLPDQIVNRRKTGFVVPVVDWLRDGDEATGARGFRDWANVVMRQHATA